MIQHIHAGAFSDPGRDLVQWRWFNSRTCASDATSQFELSPTLCLGEWIELLLSKRETVTQLSGSKSRVLLVGIDTAGYLTGLKAGFLSNGYQVEWLGVGNVYDYGRKKSEPISDTILSFWTWDRIKSRVKACPPIMRALRPVYSIFVRPLVTMTLFLSNTIKVLKISRDFEIVVYNHGQSITGFGREFAYLRRSGVKLVFVFHGSDIRPAYLNGAIWGNRAISLAKIRKIVRRQSRNVRKFERHSDLTISWSGNTHFFTQQIYLHEHLGFPLSNWDDLNKLSIRPSRNEQSTSPIKALHSPSAPWAKGTMLIQEVVDRLKDGGLQLVFETLSGVPHHEVMSALMDTDFVIDQVYSDTAAGVFAAEASMLGKPAIVAASETKWLCDLLRDHMPPTCFVPTFELENEIVRLATDVDYRQTRGQESMAHFKKLWNPEEVVRRYLDVLYSEGNCSQPVDPLSIEYARGGFAEKRKISEVVSAYVNRYGPAALALSHNRPLQKAVIDAYASNELH